MATPSHMHSTRLERSPDSFRLLQERNAAAEILQSYEKLSWFSYLRCESLQQTRLHFQNIVAGFAAEDEAARVDWPTDNTPIPNRNVDGSQRSRRKDGGSSSKGKERLSSGGAQAGSSPAMSSSSGSKGKEKAKGSGARDDDSSAKKKRKSLGAS